jgi:hypothetical protein
LLERIGQRLLVVGRCQEEGQVQTGLSWPRDARLDLISLLPSGGDTSHAALAPAGEGHWMLSYYPSHEVATGSCGLAAIYLGMLASD